MTEEVLKTTNEEKDVAPIESASVDVEKKIISKRSTSKGKKSKKTKQISHGRAYVQATYNNTIITLTDLNGNVLAHSSAGQNGFKGPKKSTPYAAGVIVKDAVEKSKAFGLKDVKFS